MRSIGRYQVQSELGRGAMGVVYRAFDPTIGRTVALKTMRLDAQGIEGEEMLKRFRNEARAAGVLAHPNIVTIYDAGEDQGLFYLAMEHIEGHTLASVLEKDRVLPMEQIISIGRHVAIGLDFAHSKSVIHRDIKPANIMIAADHVAKIMDFGIAKAGSTMTQTGQVVGTPHYMSPEQVRGRPLDGRTDLFSLGVVLYEMATGEKPFTGDNVTTIIYKIVNEDPKRPVEIGPDVHPGLSEVIMRCLSKDPDRRYDSGAELAKELATCTEKKSDDELSAGIVAVATTQFAAPVLATSATAVPVKNGTAAALAPSPIPAARPDSRSLPKAPTARATQTRRVYGATRSQWVLALVILAVALVLVAMAGRNVRKRAMEEERLRADLQKHTQSAAPPASATQLPQPQTEVAAANSPAISPKPTISETPAHKPAPTTGELRLTSVPSGATVQIDGRSNDLWVTPMTVRRLAPGRHSVRLSLPNYAAEKRSVEIVAGEKAVLETRLQSNLGTVHISSDPVGAMIFLNNQPTGQNTPADFSLPPGENTFLLRMPGYDETGGMITVLPGQKISFAPKLTPSEGALSRYFRADRAERGQLVILTQPFGAAVEINGRPLQLTTPMQFPIREGRYKIVIRKEGFRALHREVEVLRGKQTVVNEQLSAN